ncbi:hypothetical protein Cni_G00928 [Canna indica]|uniref:Uncharacterized protein n=1 Tax=Canna indica TaxID=4628 RepID=A0AAQ3JNI4_9LILI|nr:hypothetical protein Cni_G00928 [Canna indica]
MVRSFVVIPSNTWRSPNPHTTISRGTAVGGCISPDSGSQGARQYASHLAMGENGLLACHLPTFREIDLRIMGKWIELVMRLLSDELELEASS